MAKTTNNNLQKWVYDSNKMSWGHKYYDIPFIWNDLGNQGDGITIAIIDTGIDSLQSDFVANIHSLSKSFVDDTINDLDGHGTKMAGIIGSSGNKVFGIAPKVKLLILKAAQRARGANSKKFAEALDYASSIKEVDIISFSNIFLSDDIDMKKAIQKCTSANKIVVAAIGNNRDFFQYPNGSDDDTFPACFDGVISVGAFDQNGNICTFSNWNSRLCFLAPGENIFTTNIDNSTAYEKGTSIATAFTSGCLALILSFAKKNAIQSSKCLSAILNTCDDIGSTIGRDIQSGFGRINLRNAISKLK